MLGKEVRCKITGFQGIVIGTVQYITGCNKVLIQPRQDPATWDFTPVVKINEGEWIDDNRVEIIGEGMDPEKFSTDTTTGDDKEAPKM